MNRQAVLERLRTGRPVIAPSMLKCNFGNLHRDFEQFQAAGTELIHLDVMDGHFVPNLSYGPMVIERMRELSDAPFDAHLMISEPARYLDEYLKVGCDMITVHLEAVPEPVDLLQEIRRQECCSGLAINPGTPVESLEPFLEYCDQVLVMSVEPGFGGQKFDPVAVEKLSKLRQMAPEMLLSVDGGIGPQTIGLTAEAGANLFVCGSSVFDEPDFSIAIQALTESASGPFASSTPES